MSTIKLYDDTNALPLPVQVARVTVNWPDDTSPPMPSPEWVGINCEAGMAMLSPSRARTLGRELLERADEAECAARARVPRIARIGAGVRHAFKPRAPGSQWVEGPLSETCDLCGCDPRNEVHV